MRFLLLAGLLVASSAYATNYNLVSTSTMQTNYGATVYVCTYASAQGNMFSITLPPGQTCALSIIR